MKLNLSRYEGSSFDAAVDVLDAVVDDVTRLIEDSPDERLTPERLAGYRSQAVREFYAAHGIRSGQEDIPDTPVSSRNRQEPLTRNRQLQRKGPHASAKTPSLFAVISRLWGSRR